MVNDVKGAILHDSKQVDDAFLRNSRSYSNYALALPVPSHHARAKVIHNTKFSVEAFSRGDAEADMYYLVDSGLRSTFIAELLGEKAHWIESSELTLKEITWLDTFIAENIPENVSAIVGIGGGILLNAAPYIAEKHGCDFVSVPTTVLAAADSAIGGLIRMNLEQNGQIQRSAYKSVYEPSKIILDPRFLQTLPEAQIRFGLSEVIKHGAYQSLPLLAYIASDSFDWHHIDDLLKAICWTVALKNIAIIYDPDSQSFGGDILRGGHTLARELEEKSNFKISHGEAVAIGVYQDKLSDPAIKPLLDGIYKRLNLPKEQQTEL